MRQEKALELVNPGRALLDIGCARGAVAAALSTRFEEVHGVDENDEMLAEAAGRGLQTRRVDLNAEPLPYEEATFDAALCLEVIEHVVDPRALVREIARVLRPGGSLYLSTPNIRFVGYLRQLILGGRFPLTSDDPVGFHGGHIHFFTFDDVARLLREASFDRIEHHGLAGGRAKLLARYVPRAIAREFLSVGIFTVARRAEGQLQAPKDAARERRFA
jgi:2-polyprenyl-6-hydroxyphenyl methylase/3-demethylubiquinone-9 3-methyltransferase